MPLVNSVIKTVVRRINPASLVVQEIGGDSYIFTPPTDLEAVESEILHIRVEDFQRAVLIGELPSVGGVVVDREFQPELFVERPITLSQKKTWNPAKAYGPEAAVELFPWHSGDFRVMEFVFPEMQNVQDDLVQKMQNLLNKKDHDEAELLAHEMLAQDLQMFTAYDFLAAYYMARSKVELAVRYLKAALAFFAKPLEDAGTDFILDRRSVWNNHFLASLQRTGQLLELMKAREEALACFKQGYLLDPYDHLGNRIFLTRLGNEKKLPGFRNEESIEVDPYLFVGKYNMPIHDRYEPNMKIDPEKWLEWSFTYRMVLINIAHVEMARQVKKKEDYYQHINLHYMMETALALNDPPGIRLTLARLIGSGMQRHEALHVAGEKLQEIFQQASEQEEDLNAQDTMDELYDDPNNHAPVKPVEETPAEADDVDSHFGERETADPAAEEQPE